MTPDDVVHRFRLRLFALADEVGNVRAVCRMLGSTARRTIAGGDRCGSTASPSAIWPPSSTSTTTTAPTTGAASLPRASELPKCGHQDPRDERHPSLHLGIRTD